LTSEPTLCFPVKTVKITFVWAAHLEALTPYVSIPTALRR